MEVRRGFLPWAATATMFLLFLDRASAAVSPTDGGTEPLSPRSTHQGHEATVTPPGPPTPTPHASRTTLKRILFAVGPDNEDYYDDTDYEDEPSTRAPTHAPATACDFDRCRHMQVPCEELQRVSHCLCPGVSGPHVRPDPPRLQEVQAAESAVTLHWCAPSSAVERYLVTLRRDGDSDPLSSVAFNATFRLATISGLEPAASYLVCVVATNQAGASEVSQAEWGPCRAVQTPVSQLRYLYLGLGLGIGAAVVLLVATVLTWHCHCRRKKSILHGAAANVPGPAGVPNMSYRSESVEQL